MSKTGELAERFFGGKGLVTGKSKGSGHKESPILITIDLGANCIRVMAAKIDSDDKIHVLGAVSNPIDQAIVEDGIVSHTTRMANLIEESFGQLAPIINHYRKSKRSKNEPYSSVYISVGDSSLHDSYQTSVRRFHSGHRITSRDIDEMKSECIEHATAGENTTVYQDEAIEHILNETEITDNPINEVAESLSTRYHFLVGDMKLKEKLTETFARIGNLALEQTFSKAAALGYAILSEDDYQNGCAIIDFGGGTTSLHIFKDSQLIHSESFPYGSNLITRDISTVGLLESTSEKLKKQKGKAMEELVETDVKVRCRSAQTGEEILIRTSDLAYIIECRLKEMFSRIFRTLNEYSDRAGAKVYLTGLGAELEGFDEFVSKYTNYDVRYASHKAWLAADTAEKYWDPTYTQLIGTTLLASDYLENNEAKQTPVIKSGVFKQTAITFFD